MAAAAAAAGSGGDATGPAIPVSWEWPYTQLPVVVAATLDLLRARGGGGGGGGDPSCVVADALFAAAVATLQPVLADGGTRLLEHDEEGGGAVRTYHAVTVPVPVPPMPPLEVHGSAVFGTLTLVLRAGDASQVVAPLAPATLRADQILACVSGGAADTPAVAAALYAWSSRVRRAATALVCATRGWSVAAPLAAATLPGLPPGVAAGVGTFLDGASLGRLECAWRGAGDAIANVPAVRPPLAAKGGATVLPPPLADARAAATHGMGAPPASLPPAIVSVPRFGSPPPRFCWLRRLVVIARLRQFSKAADASADRAAAAAAATARYRHGQRFPWSWESSRSRYTPQSPGLGYFY